MNTCITCKQICGFSRSSSPPFFTVTRQRRHQWEVENPKWEDDPFYVYNPNYMRFKKKEEEQIILTRPEYYAIKDLREKYGLVMQPPYLPVEKERALLDMDGNPIITENDGYSNKVAVEKKK